MLIVPAKSRSKVRGFTEDEITSTVFGPLKFMTPRDAWMALSQAALVPKTAQISGIPSFHSVMFSKLLQIHMD
jgi:hypothetical protein